MQYGTPKILSFNLIYSAAYYPVEMDKSGDGLVSLYDGAAAALKHVLHSLKTAY